MSDVGILVGKRIVVVGEFVPEPDELADTEITWYPSGDRVEEDRVLCRLCRPDIVILSERADYKSEGIALQFAQRSDAKFVKRAKTWEGAALMLEAGATKELDPEPTTQASRKTGPTEKILAALLEAGREGKTAGEVARAIGYPYVQSRLETMRKARKPLVERVHRKKGGARWAYRIMPGRAAEVRERMKPADVTCSGDTGAPESRKRKPDRAMDSLPPTPAAKKPAPELPQEVDGADPVQAVMEALEDMELVVTFRRKRA